MGMCARFIVGYDVERRAGCWHMARWHMARRQVLIRTYSVLVVWSADTLAALPLLCAWQARLRPGSRQAAATKP